MTPAERKETTVNTIETTSRRRRTRRVDYQMPATPQTSVETSAKEDDKAEDTSKKNVVRTTDFGEVRKGFFSITVKDGDKVLYENDKEEYEYDVVDSLVNALRHAGAVLSQDQIDFIGSALVVKDDAGNETADSKKTGEAVAVLVKTYNAKEKADAKSSAYQTLVNKHKPLEGEKRETAIARTIANVVKLAGISAETAIEMLKSKGAVPEDYTVADYNATPLRRVKGDNDED